MPSILLIEDTASVLSELAAQVRDALADAGTVDVQEWLPAPTGRTALEELAERVTTDTVLVVTDYDLTRSKSGILGDSVLRWCQREAVPAVLYSRGEPSLLPTRSDLLELKVPRILEAGSYIAALYEGFLATSEAVASSLRTSSPRNPATVLATILGKPDIEYELAQYMVGVGDTSGALTARVSRTAPTDAEPEEPEQGEVLRVLTYVLGHVMVNAVLKYPGPLLPMAAVCAYIGTTQDEGSSLAELFDNALYKGPFSGIDKIYWRSAIDGMLDNFLTSDEVIDTNILRRTAVERALGRQLETHECTRCGGVNGGFFCPFSERAVCEQPGCSTASTSWLPQGATACRIELEFFEEWAPLLGY